MPRRQFRAFRAWGRLRLGGHVAAVLAVLFLVLAPDSTAEPLPPPTVEAIPVLAFTPVAPAVTTLSAQGATQVPATRSPFAATGQPPVARTAPSAPPRANSAAGTSGGGSASGTPEGHIPVSIPVAAPARPAAAPARPAAAPGGRVIYLTFDDGPGPHTGAVLDLLAQYRATATFFMLGRSAAEHPNVLDRVRAEGHTLGNHTWDHPKLTALSPERLAAELDSTDAVLGRQACVRPPYGATSPSVQAAIAARGQRHVLWDVDPTDWARPGADVIASRVIGSAHPGAVVLLHDAGGDRSQTVTALRTILSTLAGQGYSFRALPGC